MLPPNCPPESNLDPKFKYQGLWQTSQQWSELQVYSAHGQISQANMELKRVTEENTIYETIYVKFNNKLNKSIVIKHQLPLEIGEAD